MGSSRFVSVFLLILSMQASAAGFVFDDEAAKVGESGGATNAPPAVVSNDSYRPTEPPRGSYSPMMDYDPALTAELTQRPGESDQQYLERTKQYYKKSVTEMHRNLEQLNQTMVDLSPQNILGKHK
ncbi:TPA: hypothetical protein ACSP3W_000396 [Aeromonas veronii]|uniref:hypothetical protein n=1 Tax=Aeromonas TaxID=642 RepID=UPI00187E53C6|nr:hypothetical protein [Aeromonas veronii]MBE8745294.1 hypothetical protein [Aeromonas veronii]